MLSADIALPDVEELHKLVDQGQEKGFLTYDEVATALEDVDLTKEQIEDFTAYLSDQSIELVEGEQHKTSPLELAPAPPVEEEVKAAAPKLDTPSSRRSTRCGSTCARSARSRCSPPTRRWPSRSGSSAATWPRSST